MYNIVTLGGTTLTRLLPLCEDLNIVSPATLDDFKKYVNKGYTVILNGLTNDSLAEFTPYIDYIEQNNIHVFVDAMYESNIMTFHLSKKLDTPSTLLISNQLATEHVYFDNVITFPYFELQSYVLWKNLGITPLTYEQHLNTEKNSFVCLNGVNKPGRRFAYKYLRKNNIIDDCLFTFHNRGSEDNAPLIEEYPTRTLANDTENNDDGVTWDNTYNPNWFLNTNFNYVTESTCNNETSHGDYAIHRYDNCFFPTEKTFKPIFNCHPFMCLSDVDYHKNLKEIQGYELYDEVFTYTFDRIEESEHRWLVQLEQVEYLHKHGLDMSLIKEKLLYNQNLFLDEKRHKDNLLNLLNQIDKHTN
jgi:hypothetical protein